MIRWLSTGMILTGMILGFCGCSLFKSSSSLENEQVGIEETTSIEDAKDGVPEITFDVPLHDFGDVIKGESREYSFTFTNTGDGNLEIELATACTCTSIDWPRSVIPPGGKGEIPIVFDSSTKDGETLIDVDIIANTDPIVVTAQFKANVIPKEP